MEVLRQILEHSKFAVTLVDLEGKLTLFNRAAERLTGYSRDEVMGQSVNIFYPSADDLQKMLDVVFSEGKLEDFETRLLNKEGEKIPISIFISLLHDPSGNPVGSLGITMDLRERHRLEADLRQAKNRADFYTDLLCHDIRNYDQTILGYLDMLLSGMLGEIPEEQARILMICQRQAKRMNNLIERVQTLSNLEYDDSVVFEPIDLVPLIEKTIETVREAYPDKSVEVDFRYAPEARVLACPLINDLLFNVISNSVNHNDSEKPRIWLALEAGELKGRLSWRVIIEDDGPGIRDQYKQQVFERFTHFNAHGTGIGLSLVQALINRYGGRIWVEDRISDASEEGARFIAELPAA